LDFANNLSRLLGIDLEKGIDGVPRAGVDDWLEERFGGVVGYITELLLDISNGYLVSEYMSNLSDRVNSLIVKAAGTGSSVQTLSQAWLSQLKSPRNNWQFLRDAGLCGRQPPRGVLFTLILEWLCIYAPEENALALVHRFRSMFSGDPGLDGCLLELEEILKLKASESFQASLLTLNGSNWIAEQCLYLPSKASHRLSVFQYLEYLERDSVLDEIFVSEHSSWNLIQVPSGFDVIDVVLVDVSAGSPAIYGIQITRSKKPFAKHHTFDTCDPASKERLKNLWSLISHHFKLGDNVQTFYVMLAPNCEKVKFKPPAGHESGFYFAPTTVITENDYSSARERGSHPVPAREPLPKKKRS
jgi:hypothetical protein